MSANRFCSDMVSGLTLRLLFRLPSYATGFLFGSQRSSGTSSMLHDGFSSKVLVGRDSLPGFKFRATSRPTFQERWEMRAESSFTLFVDTVSKPFVKGAKSCC